MIVGKEDKMLLFMIIAITTFLILIGITIYLVKIGIESEFDKHNTKKGC